MLQGIWKYYKYSCKAVREIKELADMMGERAYKAVKKLMVPGGFLI